MVTWLYDTWGRMSRQDYLVIITMLFIIAYRGFITGMISGVLLSIVLFAVEYARMGAIQQDFMGNEYQSANSSRAKARRYAGWRNRYGYCVCRACSSRHIPSTLPARQSRLEFMEENQDILKYIILDFQMVKALISQRSGLQQIARSGRSTRHPHFALQCASPCAPRSGR